MWKNCKDGVRIPYAICRGDHLSPVEFVSQNPSPQGERQIIFLRKIRKTLFFGGRPRVAPTFPFEEDRFQQNRPSITAVIASRRRTPGWPLLPFGQFTFWQSPGRQFVIVHCTRRFPRSLCSLGMTDLGVRAIIEANLTKKSGPETGPRWGIYFFAARCFWSQSLPETKRSTMKEAT